MLRTRSESHESLMTQIKKTYRDSHKNLKQAQLNLDAAIQNVNEARMLVASSFDLLDYFTKYKTQLLVDEADCLCDNSGPALLVEKQRDC